jgi:hypothetical protein
MAAARPVSEHAFTIDQIGEIAAHERKVILNLNGVGRFRT